MDDIPVAQRLTSLTTPSPRRRWRQLGWIGSAISGALLLLGLAVNVFRPPTAVAPVIPVAQTQQSPQQLPSGAQPAEAQPSGSQSVLGHFAFKEAPQAELQSLGRYGDRSIKLRKNAAQSYLRMAAAARQAGITLVPISGFRSIKDQEYLFFKKAQERALRPEERALVSAPPGYSEHHTGYAIDVGDAAAPGTTTRLTFADTRAGRWLQANAAKFSFELSFPKNNPQGVSYEPWHWRYVGDRASLETFYDSRSRPAQPQNP